MMKKVLSLAIPMAMISFAALAAKDEHHEKASGGLPQLDLSWFPSQIFWLGISFTILYVIFSNKIVPSIAANIENRDQSIQNDLETADRLTKEATEFQENYEEHLKNAHAEASKMLSDLDQKMKKDHEKKQATFLKKTEEQMAETKKRLEKMTADSMSEVESHIEETALIAAKNIAGIDTDGKAAKAALKAVNSNIKVKAA